MKSSKIGLGKCKWPKSPVGMRRRKYWFCLLQMVSQRLRRHKHGLRASNSRASSLTWGKSNRAQFLFNCQSMGPTRETKEHRFSVFHGTALAWQLLESHFYVAPFGTNVHYSTHVTQFHSIPNSWLFPAND